MADCNNLEEYADPRIYDCENRDFEPDGSFYLGLARRLGEPALERKYRRSASRSNLAER